MTIGGRIKKIRERLGYSQKQLAHKVGLNISVLNRIELDKRPARSEELAKIAEILEVSTDYLSGYEKSTLSPNETQEFLETIDLSEEKAIERIKEQFSYNGEEITTEQARKIYYFSLGVVQKD